MVKVHLLLYVEVLLIDRLPVMSTLPFTCSCDDGLVVPMPTLEVVVTLLEPTVNVAVFD